MDFSYCAEAMFNLAAAQSDFFAIRAHHCREDGAELIGRGRKLVEAI